MKQSIKNVIVNIFVVNMSLLVEINCQNQTWKQGNERFNKFWNTTKKQEAGWKGNFFWWHRAAVYAQVTTGYAQAAVAFAKTAYAQAAQPIQVAAAYAGTLRIGWGWAEIGNN